jgi:hypothetical protein
MTAYTGNSRRLSDIDIRGNSAKQAKFSSRLWRPRSQLNDTREHLLPANEIPMELPAALCAIAGSLL